MAVSIEKTDLKDQFHPAGSRMGDGVPAVATLHLRKAQMQRIPFSPPQRGLFDGSFDRENGFEISVPSCRWQDGLYTRLAAFRSVFH